MKKFVLGLTVGLLSGSLFVGLLDVGAVEENSIGKYSEEQLEQMKMAWYEYHHDDILRGLSCEE
ncbi:hypothetical protein J2Z23_004156 [Lederbergia galactosidilyticus]|uniref:hypothetical protein n=1 Tax=Lederbergia galactosidilytica TaxID=217031 RepID=UPI001AE8BD46|nr:hypothetical protein [Lederbergia galactosidilytica]MBP1917171.1 hypothetical protein [Lederbergia galactosidilytica]